MRTPRDSERAGLGVAALGVAALDPARFGRLNRSELVNIAFVEKMEPYFNNRLAVKLRVTPEVVLTTSAAQTPGFRRWLEG